MLWKKIQNLLDEQRMSVYRLSKLTGIPLNTLYSYKNQDVEPSFHNIDKVANALNVSLDAFKEVNKNDVKRSNSKHCSDD